MFVRIRSWAESYRARETQGVADEMPYAFCSLRPSGEVVSVNYRFVSNRFHLVEDGYIFRALRLLKVRGYICVETERGVATDYPNEVDEELAKAGLQRFVLTDTERRALEPAPIQALLD